MPALRRLLVVSHTHWDREWYHSAERFRLRLVELVDELLDDPPAADAPFLLDGQGVVLEDYLAVRPERAAELSALLRTGQIEAGPWYVLADELIPSGEALVRNLLAGRAAVRRLRGESPPVLYCPDSFGHPAALPDLALGFGCGMVVLWRGLGGARSANRDLVRWSSPGGQSVTVCHLPPDGYEFGSSLPTGASAAAERWARIAPVLGERATVGTALLLNGADHHARQRGLDVALGALSDAAGGVEVVHTGLAAAASELLDAARGVTLPHMAGELRDSYGYAWTLQGTLGARAAQKRGNASVERLLLRDVEPWIALAGDRASAGLRASLAATWRELLRCHPHDTLCGTSTDHVADAMDARVAAARLAADAARRAALDALVGHDAEQVRMSPDGWRPLLEVRNRAARARGGIVELSLAAPVAAVAVGPGSASRQGARTAAPAWPEDGTTVQLVSESEQVELTESPRAYPRADVVARATVIAWCDPLPGLSVVRRVPGRAAAASAAPEPVRVTDDSLDNGHIRAVIDAHGCVTVTDLHTSRIVTDAVRLERARDVGDLYTPAIREAIPPPAIRDVGAVLRGPLRGSLCLGFASGPGEPPATADVLLSLDAGARWLRVHVRGENGTADQRLRLVVATGIADASVHADAAFHVVPRVTPEITTEEAAMEHVVPTAPLHRYVSLFGEGAGATVHSDGLAEYEAMRDGRVAITLVRSVGELSRHDLPERPGHAGWPASVPAAQCLAPFEAVLALQPHGADTLEERLEIERVSDDVLVPLAGETRYAALGIPGEWGGVELTGPFAFSAAKPAERDGWTVLRCVNRSDGQAAGAWRLRSAVTEALHARLDETPGVRIPASDGVIRFTAGPYEIVTILVR